MAKRKQADDALRPRRGGVNLMGRHAAAIKTIVKSVVHRAALGGGGALASTRDSSNMGLQAWAAPKVGRRPGYDSSLGRRANPSAAAVRTRQTAKIS